MTPQQSLFVPKAVVGVTPQRHPGDRECECDKRPWVPDSVDILPMPDRMVGEKIGEAMNTVCRACGISVGVCSYVPSDVVVGCTERGRDFVRGMKTEVSEQTSKGV